MPNIHQVLTWEQLHLRQALLLFSNSTLSMRQAMQIAKVRPTSPPTTKLDWLLSPLLQARLPLRLRRSTLLERQPAHRQTIGRLRTRHPLLLRSMSTRKASNRRLWQV